MKYFILVLFSIITFIQGFSQNFSGNTSGWGNTLLEQEKNQMELKVYPNPCKNQKITIEFNTKEISEIRISNIAGKEVLFEKLQFPSNKKLINLENIPDGIYLLRIKTTDNKQVVKKLILSGR